MMQFQKTDENAEACLKIEGHHPEQSKIPLGSSRAISMNIAPPDIPAVAGELERPIHLQEERIKALASKKC